MAINAIAGLESFNSGSNYKFNNEQPPARPPRDLFDLGHLHTTTINNAGEVVPVLLMRVVPGDSFDFNVSSLLRVLPQVVPPFSGQRGYIHFVFGRDSDLYDYAGEYIRKGYTGTSILKKPVMTEENMGAFWSKKVAAGDLLDYLGLPQGWSPKEISDVVGGISVLPAFMYWKAVNQFYRNKNAQINDRVSLPESFDELRLNRENQLISNKNADVDNDYPNGNLSKKVTFGQLLCRDWTSDYFTSGFPSPQRGNAPTLSGDVSPGSKLGSLDTTSFFSYFNKVLPDPSTSSIHIGNGDVGPASYPTTALLDYQNNDSSARTLANAKSEWSSLLSRLSVVGDGSPISLGVTLENIRGLSVAQDEMERMAKTDGTFAAFGSVFFGVVSRNALDYELTYIGGTYQSINFSEVLQTSASTEQSYLGQYAGHGISAQTNGYCGHIDCDEHGYIMALYSVMPDTYYFQGLDQIWTTLLQSEEFLPERERMGLVPVLNRELFFTDSESDDSTSESPRFETNELFVYQAPFDNMRFMNNRISGKVADITNKSFSPYTQAREFQDTPKWNVDFLEAKNIRKDYLAAPSEVAYTVQFKFDIRAVRPLPYFHKAASVLN